MLNSAFIGLAAAMVMAAKGTGYVNVNEKPYLVQETGLTEIMDSEEDIFFGLASRENGLTAVYISSEGWMTTKVKANIKNEETIWDFQAVDGAISVN